mgnify:CR=1 FL=1
MSGAMDSLSSSGPGGALPGLGLDRRALPQSPLLARAAPTSGEVIQRLAEHARGVPPPSDLWQVTAAAARYALTSLDSARTIAAEIRAEQARRLAQEAVRAATGGEVNRAEIAAALAL